MSLAANSQIFRSGLHLSLKHWSTWAWIIGIFTLVELFQQIQLFLSLSERAASQIEIESLFSAQFVIREFWEIYSIALLIPLYWALAKRMHFLSTSLVLWVPLIVALLISAVLFQQLLFRLGLVGINIGTGWYGESSAALIFGRWSMIPMLSASAFYVLILGGLYGLDAYVRWQERETLTARLEKQLSEARLQALQSQLQPHFLFNTLQTIAASIHSDPQAAERMTIKIGDLLRSVLRYEEQTTISLESELSLARDYLELHEVRFGDKLRITWKIEPETLNAHVPTLILQPIIENALEHGLQHGGGSVTIISELNDGLLRLRILNDGVCIDRTELNFGTGLQNTLERIKSLYPGEGSFGLSQSANGWTEAVIEIPYQSEISEFSMRALQG